MVKRKSIEYGSDMTGAEIWRAWARETHEQIVVAVGAARLRVNAFPDEEAVPQK